MPSVSVFFFHFSALTQIRECENDKVKRSCAKVDQEWAISSNDSFSRWRRKVASALAPAKIDEPCIKLFFGECCVHFFNTCTQTIHSEIVFLWSAFCRLYWEKIQWMIEIKTIKISKNRENNIFFFKTRDFQGL